MVGIEFNTNNYHMFVPNGQLSYQDRFNFNNFHRRHKIGNPILNNIQITGYIYIRYIFYSWI